MQKVRKKPQRKCIGCNEMKEKRELVRVVKNKEGAIFFDHTGKANGRGAYLCQNVECFRKAKKAHRLENALKSQIPSEVYDQLEKEIVGEYAE